MSSNQRCYVIRFVAKADGWPVEMLHCGVSVGYSVGRQTHKFSGCLGFSALPAGNCNGSSFNNAGNNANFWSATSNSGNNAYNRNLNNSNAGVNRNNNNKNNGRSVRCLRDN